MLTVAVATAMTGAVLLAIAGNGWWVTRLPRRSLLGWEHVVIALTAGVSISLLVILGGSYVAGLWPGWVLLASGLLGWGRAGRAVTAGPASLRLRWNWWVAGAAASAGIGILAYWRVSCVPTGSDGVFHCLLAKSFLVGRHPVTIWEPFEPVGVNYPQGAHALIAAITAMTGCELSDVYRAAVLWLSLAHVTAFYLLARRLLARDGAAAVASWLFVWACTGGAVFQSNEDSSFPSLFVQLCFVCYLLCLFRRHRGALRAGLLLAAMPAVHHLGSLITACILGVYLVVCWFAHRRRTAVWMLRTVGWQLVAVGWYVVFLGRRLVAGAGTNDSLRFLEEGIFGPGQIVATIGWPAVILGLAGLWLWWRRRGDVRRHRLLACWLGVLTGVYLLVGQVYPRICLRLEGQEFTALTPSRWLSMLGYPLAILGGLAIAACWQHRARWARPLAVVLLLAALGTGSLPRLVSLTPGAPGLGLTTAQWQLYHRLAAQLPDNAFILSPSSAHGVDIGWLEYCTWRESHPTPLPASESRHDPVVIAKNDVMYGGQLDRLRAWLARRGKVGYVLMPASGVQPVDALSLVATIDGYRLYRIEPLATAARTTD